MVSMVAASVAEPKPSVAPPAQPVQTATPHPMPEYRRDAFARAVAARLREGTAVEKLVQEQRALAAALSDPAFERAMASAFIAEIKQQQPNAEYAVAPEAVLQQVKGILANRVADANGFIGLLTDPTFLAAARAEAEKPAPAAKEYDLPQAKKEEIVRRLVQANDPDGAEPAVHIAASALGQRIVHQTLANIFRPKAGNLRPELVDALARHWPEATGAELEALATSWLKARHDPAHSIADGLKVDGPLYKEAMQRIAPATALATPPVPAAKVQTPTVAPTKLAPSPELMMDNL